MFLRLQLEKGTPFYVVIRATDQGLAACSTKRVPSFLSYFKTLSIRLAPGIEPATFRSAVNRFTDWANPAAIIVYGFLHIWKVC